MLTLYYAGATFLQSWRIKNVCSKISEQLAQQSSISFYTLTPDHDDGYDANLATSELCSNRNAAKVSELLWLKGNTRGCCLRPIQSLQITPWITFPEAPSWTPFAYESISEEVLAEINKENDTMVHLLVEAEIQPSLGATLYMENVKIEDYGKLIAWKIDSNFAVLIETNVEHFTKLLISTYLQNNCLINDQLPLIRIESVIYEGKPQPFELVSSHLRKSTRSTAQQSAGEWKKHLEILRSLSVLASQATEFQYKQNRTEGKTGVVSIKPDLIAHESKGKDNEATATPKKTTSTSLSKETDVVDAEVKSVEITKEAGKTKDPELKIVTEAAPSPIIATNSTKPLKAKPTEIKKPAAATIENRFKTSKVTESPSKSKPPRSTPSPEPSTSRAAAFERKSSSKTSELEKLAAATAAATQSQNSPSRTSSPATPSRSASVSPRPPEVESPKHDVAAVAASSATAYVSASKDHARRPSLKRNKDSLNDGKPLNILVYSDSSSARESAITTLRDILEEDTYTVYPMTSQQVQQKHWFENTALLVVCGTVPDNYGSIFVDYFLRGGKVVSICSDILHFILPTYRTAEVREHELVQFSYDKWHKVKMMHHIFCYQPSPVKKNFSTDSDDAASQANVKKPALVCPRSIELKDLHGDSHNLDVQVLGTEETWNTPSLLLANNIKSGGKAIFSQVHLETSPNEFEGDEQRFSILKQNEKIRLEIFADLLKKHLNVFVKQKSLMLEADQASKCIYQNAYFLGRHESKFELLEKLKSKSGTGNVIATSKLTLQFCGKDDKPPHANTNILPILIHSCPDDFSTVEYFDNLKAKSIGRLVIYAPVVSSSMNVIGELELMHGIAVIPRQQTEGVGRSNNQWLSPLGCAMFSIQLHIDMSSQLGGRLPLLQHIIGTAMANTLKGHEIYKELDISLKWPNDIYSGTLKIGGLVVKTTILGSKAIVNIGCAINLDNSKPTVCINDLIANYNKKTQKNLPLLKYEQLLALMFNEIEKLLEDVEVNGFENFYKLYYKLWLHTEQTITICDAEGNKKNATVVGIDDYGFLKVKLSNGAIEIVQPDGNSFDMLKGLIVPKFN